MTVSEAYQKGLIKVGRRIITNGNCDYSGDGNNGEIKIKGTIIAVTKVKFYIKGSVYYEERQKTEFFDRWIIYLDNSEAYITFLKGISPYAWWLKGIEK